MAIGGTRRKLETARCTIRILHLIVEDDRESESRCRQRTLEFLEEPEAKLSGNQPDPARAVGPRPQPDWRTIPEQLHSITISPCSWCGNAKKAWELVPFLVARAVW
jgi:hypothetical protein